MRNEDVQTIKEHLYWSYANLGMAHAALSAGADAYDRMHFIIRNKLYAGLMDGTMKLGSLKEDERLKLVLPQACCYCGDSSVLTLDHLIPLSRGGADTADNVVWACRSCNSSKGGLDLLEWHEKTGRFPSILLLRRYMKIAIDFCSNRALMDVRVDDAPPLPFSLKSVPLAFPELVHLKLWVTPLREDCLPPDHPARPCSTTRGRRRRLSG